MIAPETTTIAVFGGGTMGAGIALLGALQGLDVVLVEAADEAAEAAGRRLDDELARRVARGRTATDDAGAVRRRVTVTTDVGRIAPATVVIEAVPEILAVKQAVLETAAAAAPDAALASNTSSIPIAEIAAGLRAPERLVGLHFFNPPVEMPLVELIVPEGADPTAVATVRDVATALGRTVIDAADAPGFVVNRCARPFYLEALRVLGEGDIAAAAIDDACVAAGFPLGPLALIDVIGLDVSLAVSTSIWERGEREPRWAPSPIQRRLVAEGRLGRKTGEGFYAYPRTDAPLRRGDDPVGAAEAAAGRMVAAIDALLAGPGAIDGTDQTREGPRAPATADADVAAEAPSALTAPDLTLARIVAQLVNEAAFAVADGVADAATIDRAMTVGLRHPVGPSQWRSWLGSERIVALLERLGARGGDPAYRIAPGLAYRVSDQATVDA